MIKGLFLSIHVTFSISANNLIYFFKHLPWLGKKLPDSLYKHSKVKLVLALVAELVKFILGFVGSALALGLFVIGPFYLIDKNPADFRLIHHYLFFFCFFTCPLVSNIIFQSRDLGSYTMLQALQMPRKGYFISKIIYTLVRKLVRYAAILMVLSVIGMVSCLQGLMLAGYIVLAAAIWEYLFLVVFMVTKKNPYNPILPVGIGVLAVLIVMYGLPFLGLSIGGGWLTSGIVFITFVLFAAFSFWRLWAYEDYSGLTRKVLERESVLLARDMMKNAAFVEVNLAEDKLSQRKDCKADRLQGYELLNHLFFTRYARIIKKPAVYRAIVISIAGLVLWGLIYYHPDHPAWHPKVQNTLLSSTNFAVFLMYGMSIGNKLTKALFFSCDRYLLREHYYREKQVILKNFTLRLKQAIRINLVPALAIVIILLGAGLLAGMGSEVARLLPVAVSVLSLSLFFSIHYLFVYYLLQPYTSELTAVSPLATLLNAAVYFFSYGMIHLKTSSLIFTGGVIAFTLVYAGVAVILTYHLAPRTFRLK